MSRQHSCESCEAQQFDNNMRICYYKDGYCYKRCVNEECNKEIQIPYKKRKRVRYCNASCATTQRYIEERRKEGRKKGEGKFIKICPVCQKEFKAHKKEQVCCSYSCSFTKINKVKTDKVNEEIKLGLRETLSKKYKRICNCCQKEYFSKDENSKFCSRQCSYTVNTFQKMMMNKYGVKNSVDIQGVKEKIEQTMLKKYGVKTPLQLESSKKKCNEARNHFYNREKLQDKDFINNNFVENDMFLIDEFMYYFNIKSRSMAVSLKNQLNITAPNKTKTRVSEDEIYSFIKEYYQGEVFIRDRNTISPLELDIYIPEKKLAIEFNGMFFHSYGHHKFNCFNNTNINRNRHLEKTLLCEEKGIQLLHIFEYEWVRNAVKRNIWKSVILSKLGLLTNKIYARNCIIKNVASKTSGAFLSENHLQGDYKPANIRIGLYYNDDLIALMTFSKSRFSEEKNWELVRYASKINTVVVGGFSKLLKYFLVNYNIDNNPVISYGNRRWVSKISNLYINNKFVLEKESQPNYFYFNNSNALKLYSRIEFQKHKLKNKLDKFDNSLSEIQNMFNNGYRIIYDSGNLVFKYGYPAL